jgi:MFS superfamily sulfate permease-like transporter
MSAYMAWAVLVGLVPLVVIYMWKRVIYYRKKQYAHLPQLPPSLVWGHLATIGKLKNTHKENIHVGKSPKFLY